MNDIDHRPTQDAQRIKNLTMLVYALQAGGVILPILVFIAMVINYLKLDDVAGTIYASHFRWQIRTFWFWLLWVIIGGITTLILIGYLILGLATLWFIYRIARGMLRLSDERGM